jgi:Flp pilus assembly pilin Flp
VTIRSSLITATARTRATLAFFVAGQGGATVMEYGLVAAGIGLVALAALRLFVG